MNLESPLHVLKKSTSCIRLAWLSTPYLVIDLKPRRQVVLQRRYYLVVEQFAKAPVLEAE